jgi:hypothetical protein
MISIPNLLNPMPMEEFEDIVDTEGGIMAMVIEQFSLDDEIESETEEVPGKVGYAEEVEAQEKLYEVQQVDSTQEEF